MIRNTTDKCLGELSLKLSFAAKGATFTKVVLKSKTDSWCDNDNAIHEKRINVYVLLKC